MTKSEYEQLYAALRKPVLRIIYASVRCDHSLANELSQQVWLKVWRYKDNDMPDARHWVYSIARSVVASHFRRAKIRNEQSVDWQEVELTDDQTERNARLTEEHDRLSRLREVLPSELHPILDAWLTGKSDIEIGRALAIPAGSVAWHKNRVREYASRIR